MLRKEETLRQPSPLKDIRSRASGGAFEEPLGYEVGTPVMIKQDIIREGMWEFILEIRQYLCNTEFAPEPFTAPVDLDVLREMGNAQLKKMDSQGVVIKVKCPDCVWSQFGEEHVGMTPCDTCNSTGYILESLVGE